MNIVSVIDNYYFIVRIIIIKAFFNLKFISNRRYIHFEFKLQMNELMSSLKKKEKKQNE